MLTKVPMVNSMVFPVVMCRCENWIIKKAKWWRIDAFELYWRRLLTAPWTARGSNQSVLKEINPEYSLHGLMLKLKLQYFGHLMQRADSLKKTLMLGRTEGKRRKGQQRMWCLGGIADSTNRSLSKLKEIVKDREAWHAAVHGSKSDTICIWWGKIWNLSVTWFYGHLVFMSLYFDIYWITWCWLHINNLYKFYQLSGHELAPKTRKSSCWIMCSSLIGLFEIIVLASKKRFNSLSN